MLPLPVIKARKSIKGIKVGDRNGESKRILEKPRK